MQRLQGIGERMQHTNKNNHELDGSLMNVNSSNSNEQIIRKRTGVPENDQHHESYNLSVGKLKSLTENTLLLNTSNGADTSKRAHLTSNENSWNKKFTETCLHILFNFLLATFYCIFAMIRYFQYVINRIKIKIFNLAYNPANTPQLIRRDVNSLSKIPKNLAAILEYKSEEDVGGGVLGLMDGSSDLVAWSLSSGIKHLVLYDYNGILKKDVDMLRYTIYNKLAKYFGPNNVPKYAIRIPRTDSIYYNTAEQEVEEEKFVDNADNNTNFKTETNNNKKVSIEITLLSNVDGRETVVELTRTMAELCYKKELDIKDVTMELVDKELIQLVGNEPDLLLYFGPNLDLQGYPPWHIRLTEFYWEPDNDEVTYSVFIRGLKKYATCKINVGK
ncbi:hypothetical protein ACO0RG_004271 [Hanseniaspora osmophila]